MLLVQVQPEADLLLLLHPASRAFETLSELRQSLLCPVQTKRSLIQTTWRRVLLKARPALPMEVSPLQGPLSQIFLATQGL